MTDALCTRRGGQKQRWRRRRPAAPTAIPTLAVRKPAESQPCLWLISADDVCLNEADHTGLAPAAEVGRVSRGEVVEARLVGPGAAWAKLTPAEELRLLDRGCVALLDLAAPGVVAFGGRDSVTGEVWFFRDSLGGVVRQRPVMRAPCAPPSALKRLKTMDGRKVEAIPPLRVPFLADSLTR